MIEALAAVLAWLGAALIVLSDGRRGLAVGLFAASIAFASLAWSGGQRPAAVAILVCGAIASLQRLRSGAEGWGIMPAGSTPRLVLCIASGLVALWVGASVTNGPGAPLRTAVLAFIALMGARVLSARDVPAVLTAVAALALAMGAATGLASTSPGPAPYLIGALIAAGVAFMPRAEPRGA